MSKQMNVLLIMMDQLRADTLGCMGHPIIKTPNLDRLAKQSTLFTQAYCTTPLCVPSRTTLFTSQYAGYKRGRFSNGIILGEKDQHLPGVLRENGYELVMVGKNHAFVDEYMRTWAFCEMYDLRGKEEKDFCSPLTPEDRRVRNWRHNQDIVPIQEGVVKVPQPGGIQADPNVSQTEHALRYLKSRDRNRPFFMYYSFESPHFPYVVPEEYFDLYDPETMPGPEGREPLLGGMPTRLWMQYYGQKYDTLSLWDYKRVQATYLAQVSLVDSQIGRVLDCLEQTGEMDSTLIVFTADHGDFWGNHDLIGKTNAVYQDLLRIPLMIRIPGVTAGENTEAMTDNTDVAPTLLELLDIPVPGSMQGRPVTGIARTGQGTHRDHILAESRLGEIPALTVDQLKEAIVNRNELMQKEGHSWFGKRQMGWVRGYVRQDGMKVITNENDITEMFDLNRDPLERHNLAEDPVFAGLRQELLDQMDEALKEKYAWKASDEM